MTLDSPSLRVCFDTGHANMTRNSAALIRELTPWLNYVHLADNHGLDDDHCAPGEGTVDWEALWGLFREAAFDGTFCAEFPVRADRAPFDRVQRRLREFSPPGAKARRLGDQRASAPNHTEA
jgi:sugar phosphate isomerase/epimerase